MKNLTLKFVLTLVLGLGFAFVAEAQTVKGVVKDATGEPVIGAAVVVELKAFLYFAMIKD